MFVIRRTFLLGRGVVVCLSEEKHTGNGSEEEGHRHVKFSSNRLEHLSSQRVARVHGCQKTSQNGSEYSEDT
jgi:hypothetical protein